MALLLLTDGCHGLLLVYWFPLSTINSELTTGTCYPPHPLLLISAFIVYILREFTLKLREMLNDRKLKLFQPINSVKRPYYIIIICNYCNTIK